TPTPLRAPAPQAGASAYSATQTWANDDSSAPPAPITWHGSTVELLPCQQTVRRVGGSAEVAGGGVAGGVGCEDRGRLDAGGGVGAGRVELLAEPAAGMEPAAARGVGGPGDVAGEHVPAPRP